MTENEIGVLLVDDHPAVLLGLESLLNSASDVVVLGAARDSDGALAAFLRLAPDVVVMDLSMPGGGGLQVMGLIHAHEPDARVLVLTSSTDAETVTAALDGGAAGYLFKHGDPSAVLQGVRACMRGETPVDPHVEDPLPHRVADPGDTLGLSPRERDVLHLLRQGLANKHIASRLGICEATVKTHLRHAFERIGVGDRTSAALWAHRHLSEAPRR
jgi:DNA-binding NarL/FixJ family response regulator